MPSRDNTPLNSSLGSASSAALLQYCFAAEELGVDVKAILAKFGLAALLTKGDAGRLAGEVFQQVLIELVTQAKEPCFGLYAAQFVRPESYSILGYISMNSPSLKHALARTMPFEKLVGDMGQTQILEANSLVYIRWHCQYEAPSILGVMVENVIASWGKFARWLVANEDLAAKAIHFRHACAPGTLEKYQTFFKCPVLFGQQYDQLIIESSLLEQSIKMPDLRLLEIFAEQAQQQVSQLTDDDYCYKVKLAIRDGLGSNTSNKEEVAQRLFVSGRTLQRKLEQQATGFRQLYDQVRLAEARRLLAQPQMNLERLAVALDFSDTSSMQRWFRRVAGVSARNFANDVNS